MIRNYYTEAYKGGVIPVVSNTQLVDGTVKVAYSTTSSDNVAMTTSTALVLVTANFDIKVGMIVSGTGVPAITESGYPVIILRSSGDGKNFTLSAPVSVGLNAALTYSVLNQSSWKEYNLFIGESPLQQNNFGSITSATANAASAAQKTVTWKISNPYVKAGMTAFDDGVSLGLVDSINSSTSLELVTNVPGGGIADASILTFSYTVLPSVTVTTIDNKQLTFTNPAQGFVLPVSVVQVNSVAGGVSGLLALD